ncbi:MAG: ferrous iron transport protein B [Ignavibacteriaceae bacterium]|nr:ferrous iron transport protein B [Ignavibacteriaceae bacterium]
MIQHKSSEIPLITLVGPPNSGKTTLFNNLSGSNYKTVNYPGATVEYSLGKLLPKFGLKANLLDSPGIVSLVPNSPDEEVSIKSLFSHPELGTPDIFVITIDASQLSRHLLLVNQIKKCNINFIIALTMSDILNRKNYDVDQVKLGELLDCEVIKVNGRTGNGIPELVIRLNKYLGSNGIKKCNNTKIPKFPAEELIDVFKKNELIESQVIFELNGSKLEPNIERANRQLKILVNQKSKIECYKIDEKTIRIDKLLLHKSWGLLFFLFVMTLTFTSIFWLAEPLIVLVDNIFGFLANQSLKLFGYGWFGDLIANGVISGTGSILVFVPQIIILFLILGTLEDTGYLARGAMLIDKPLSKIGLNGKSFVPMLSGFACAIPALLATRTIPNRRERLLTIFIIPLMSCSARLPVYALLLAFLLPPKNSWLGGFLLAGIYIFSIASSIVIASIVNKLKNRLINTIDNSSFILELPAYRSPKFRVVINNTYISTLTYLKKAGPIILILSLFLWLITTFPNINTKIEAKGLNQEEILRITKTERLSKSYAADLGKILEPVMTPLGMDWRVGISLIASFAAREVFVSSMALIFKVTSDENTLQSSIVTAMRDAKLEGTEDYLFTTSTIIGLIIYFVFAMQCLSTVAVARKESGGWRIPILQILVFSTIAYFLTFIAVNGLRAIGLN